MTEPCSFCPSCGHNISAERRVEIGPLSYDPLGEVLWNGAAVSLTVGEHMALGSIVHAHGRAIRRDVIGDRIGSESLSNAATVLICRLRRKLRDVGAPANTIQNVIGRGYRLNVAMLESLGSGPRQSNILVGGIPC